MRRLYTFLKNQVKLCTLNMLRTLGFVLFLLNSSALSAQNDAFQWVVGYGGLPSEFGAGITTDAAGNSYTTGAFYGTIDFDPGPGTTNLGSTNGAQAFISKLDPQGDLVWAAYLGGSNWTAATGISLDGLGNVYTAGHFTGTSDFDPGTGTNNLTATWNSYDIFVSKLDASGNFLWAKRIGKTAILQKHKIYADAVGNVYVTGLFNDAIDFDPGPGTFTLTPTGPDQVYVLKLDAAGDFVWAKSFDGASGFYTPNIHVDANNGVYVTGGFTGTVDFDPGSGVNNLTSTNALLDMFITKLDASGNFVWAEAFGSTGLDIVSKLSSDDQGNIYATGAYTGTVDFDAGPGTNSLTSGGPYNSFVLKLDGAGNYIWARSLGGTYQVIASAIQVDALGNVYSFGDYSGNTDFDPGAGTFALQTNGGMDGYISKLDALGNFVWAKNIGGSQLDRIADGAVDLNGNIFATGDYTLMADFDPSANVNEITSNGNADIYIVKLGCNTTSGTQTVTTCDSYVFNGITYTSSNNTATDTLTSAGGCDSIVTLNLTILNTTNGVDTHMACDSFTWINGVTYTASNFSTTFTLTNAAGCDSILQLDLTITSVDVSTSLSGNTITANAIGATFEWIDCQNGIAPLATGPSFTAPPALGEYAVIVTQGNCIDTSDCVMIAGVGIKNRGNSLDPYKLSPNPTTAQVSITNFHQGIDKISIFDLTGKLLNSFKPTQSTFDVSTLEVGIYFVSIQEGSKIFTQKLVKE